MDKKSLFFLVVFLAIFQKKQGNEGQGSGTESRIANRTIPRTAGLASPEIPQREATKMSRIAVKQNRGKSIQNRHPNRSLPMLKVTLESHDSNRTIQSRPIPDSESPIQCH